MRTIGLLAAAMGSGFFIVRFAGVGNNDALAMAIVVFILCAAGAAKTAKGN